MLFINIMVNLSLLRKNVFAIICVKTNFEVLLKLEIYIFIIVVRIYVDLFDFMKQYVCYC